MHVCKDYTKSLRSSGQNSLRLLCRYHCLSSESPGELIIGGRSSFDGFQGTSLRMSISVLG